MVNFFHAHPPWHIPYLPQGSVNPHFVHRIVQPGALSSGVIIFISERCGSPAAQAVRSDRLFGSVSLSMAIKIFSREAAKSAKRRVLKFNSPSCLRAFA